MLEAPEHPSASAFSPPSAAASEAASAQPVWLGWAPLAALACTAATWTHFTLTGGLQLAENPRGAVLVWTGTVSSVTLALLGWVCVQAYRSMQRSRLRAVFVSGLWMQACMLPALPLHSTDLFSYLAYGELAARGLDPSAVKPAALGQSPLLQLTTWTETPSVYGPVANLMMSLTGHIAGWLGSPLWVGLVVYKLLTVALMVTALWLAYELARRSDSEAVVRGFALLALNPVLAWEVTGQGHNDGLIVVASLFYLWTIQRSKPVLGMAALVLGTLSKYVLAPAAGLHAWATARSVSWRRAALLVAVGVGLAALFYAPSWLGGSGGQHWTPFRYDSAKYHACSLFTLIKGSLRVLGASEPVLSLAYSVYVGAGRVLVLAVAGLTLWRTDSVAKVPHATLLVLVAAVSTTVVMTPWYLTWTLPLSAVLSARWQRYALATCVVAAPAFGAPWLWLTLPFVQIAGVLLVLAWIFRSRELEEFAG